MGGRLRVCAALWLAGTWCAGPAGPTRDARGAGPAKRSGAIPGYQRDLRKPWHRRSPGTPAHAPPSTPRPQPGRVENRRAITAKRLSTGPGKARTSTPEEAGSPRPRQGEANDTRNDHPHDRPTPQKPWGLRNASNATYPRCSGNPRRNDHAQHHRPHNGGAPPRPRSPYALARDQNRGRIMRNICTERRTSYTPERGRVGPRQEHIEPFGRRRRRRGVIGRRNDRPPVVPIRRRLASLPASPRPGRWEDPRCCRSGASSFRWAAPEVGTTTSGCPTGSIGRVLEREGSPTAGCATR